MGQGVFKSGWESEEGGAHVGVVQYENGVWGARRAGCMWEQGAGAEASVRRRARSNS